MLLIKLVFLFFEKVSTIVIIFFSKRNTNSSYSTRVGLRVAEA